MNIIRLSILAICVLCTSCVSLDSMPQSADEVDFTAERSGDTGWAQWQESITVRAASKEHVFNAARVSLNRHGYYVKRENLDKGVVIGEHGMTAFDWNIVAGIYFKHQGNHDYKVRILIEGSKDIGFAGDATGGASPQMLAATLRGALPSKPAAVPDQLPPAVVRGSGFFVSPNGLIATSYHIVQDASEVKVTTQDGTVHIAEVVSTSPSTDLAVLRVETQGQKFLSVGKSSEAGMGDWVFTIGYPVIDILGAAPKFTEGSISSLLGPQSEAAYIQVSIPIQPGSSGGPVANIKGEVVGVIASTAAIANFLNKTGSLPQNINWAVRAGYLSLLIGDSVHQDPAESRKAAIARVSASACQIQANRRKVKKD